MSLIGSVVSDVSKAVTDPGALVSDAAKAILPKKMAAVGDLLGGIADIESGHPLQALSHITDALKDLPQLLQSFSGATGGAAGAAKPAGTAAAEPTTPPPRTTTTSPPSTTNTAPTTAPSPSTPAQAAASSTPAPAATPAATSTPAQPPTVTVTKLGGETITRVDDGTNTTRVTEMNGRTTIRVTNDATGKLVEGYSGSGSNISLGGGGQGPHVTIVKNGAETFTRVDNGTNTATVNQVGGRTMVATSSDARPASPPASPSTAPTIIAAPPAAPSAPATAPPLPSGLGGMIAALEKALAGTTGATAAAPTGGSTAPTSTSGNAGSASTSSASATGSTSGSSSPSSSSSATPADLQSLMALSPDQFMQAVTSGKIPDSVANSQSAMMQVQARMNQITQMNQLVTGMMAAMHQMEMSIIQNIRC